MLTLAAMLCLFVADPAPDSDVVRFGGEAAVPGADKSPEAPVEVAPRPFKPDAIYRTQGGAWRFYDGAKDRVVPAPLIGEHLVGWSPNGGSVLTALGSGRLLRWKVGTWALIGDMQLTTAPEVATQSPDGHHVLVAGKNPDGDGRRFTLFGGQIGIALQRIDRPDAVAGAPIAASDERVVIVRKDKLEILTLPRLESEHDVAVPDSDEVAGLAFAAEGGEIMLLRVDREDVAVERWSVATGQKLGSTALPRGCRRGTLAHDGRLAACLLDKPTRALVIDLPSGTVRATVAAPDRKPVFDAAGARVAFPGNRAVPVWDATIDGVLPAAARAGSVSAMAMAGDGRVAALESTGVVRVWEPVSGTETFRVSRPASALAASADGATLYLGAGPLTALDEATGAPRWVVRGSKPVAVAVAPDERVFWLEQSGDVRVRSADGKVKRLARRARATPATKGEPLDTRLLVSADGAQLLAGGRVLDAISGKVVRDARPGLAAWSGDGLVVLGADGTPVTDDGRVTYGGARSDVTALAGDAHWLVAGTRDGALHVWTPDGRVVVARALHRGPIATIVIDAAHGRIFSAGADGVILGIATP
ncbi:MAG: hypothetical protein U1F43_15560 [Myxococcota bacterium]